MNYDVMQGSARQGRGATCYAYHFDEPAVYDTAWKGRAYHSLENVFIWSGLRDTLPTAQKLRSERMAKMWLQVASGVAPWEAFNVEGKMVIFGRPITGDVSLRTVQEDSARGYKRWKQVREAGLTEEWGILADNICLRRRDLVDPEVPPIAMEPLAGLE